MNQKTIKIIKTSFDENKNSHAFLMETNSIDDCLEDVKRLIFDINDKSNFNEENIPDIKIIRPDGKEIKREQVNVIVEEFQTFPLILKHRYYIIVDSDKMNQSSANTILKFLEEPEGDIIGFFITTNKGAMISTIKSRCQHFKMLYKSEVKVNSVIVEDFISNMNKIEIYKKILYLNSFIGKERIENIENLKEVKEYLFKNMDMSGTKLLVKRVRLLDNVIERLKKNSNQELVILDLARNWK